MFLALLRHSWGFFFRIGGSTDGRWQLQIHVCHQQPVSGTNPGLPWSASGNVNIS